MPRYRFAVLALPFLFSRAAVAQNASPHDANPIVQEAETHEENLSEADLCRAVAQHLWSDVARVPLTQQTPLAELTAAAPAAFQIGGKGLAKPDQTIADALLQDHAAASDLASKLRDLPPNEATRFGMRTVWLLDRVDGTLGCHTAMTVGVAPDGTAHEISMPASLDPSALCALSALTTVSINGTPALWVEQSGAFSNSLTQSTIYIAGLRKEEFAPPCTVAVDYAVSDHATHALCDGIDCVPLIRMAEILAMRLRQEETAESLGAGVIQREADRANYRRMSEIVAADKPPAELPTFGVSLDTPFTVFGDQVTFPVRLDDGQVYLARMGHGGFGWRQTADTLLALYRLKNDQVVPAASVYIAARRAGIVGVTIE